MPETISPEECRAQAHECYQLAQEIKHPEARRELLSLVVKWSKLADMIEGDRRKLHYPFGLVSGRAGISERVRWQSNPSLHVWATKLRRRLAQIGRLLQIV